MLNENLQKIFDDIKDGNNLGEKITLVGATKMVDYETINQAISLGLGVVAENKVQEFREKTDLIVNAKQHFIGHLQTNKVKYLVGKVKLIQSVDSLHLAKEISRIATLKNITQDILIEVNVGGELSKSGVTIDNAITSLKEFATLSNINVVGFMAMLPKSDNESELTSLCDKMRNVYDTAKNNGFNLQYLSMGMSGDYKLCIKHGSNMIRLGTSIFGQRNYGEKWYEFIWFIW